MQIVGFKIGNNVTQDDIWHHIYVKFKNKSVKLMEIIRIKEQVGEKRSTFFTNDHAGCSLKNMSMKHSKYLVNQKHEHVDAISLENFLVESERCYTK
jgi:hypothetical protein